MSEDRNQAAREQAKAQLASIREMVAALECDYARLGELQEEREALEAASEEAAEAYDGNTDPAQTESLKKALLDAEKVVLDWIAENTEELEELKDAAGDCKDVDEARQRIEEDALSVEVRGGWHTPGIDNDSPEEFKILLCTGGPACRIIGDLDSNLFPERARLEFQDWFTPWEELILDSDDYDALLTYCQVFWFGE